MKRNEKGMVSIIVVIFTSLLLVLVSTSFVSMMVKEEMSAMNNNLSRMAYESAVAGVEDAKRVIRFCQNSGSAASDACKAIAAKRCTTVQDAGIFSGISDTKVKIRSGNTGSIDISGQAYTCVKIYPETEDVKYNLKEGESKVVPLKITGGSINEVKIQWYANDQSGSKSLGSSPSSDDSLPKKESWPKDWPALLRIQLVVPKGDSMQVDELDSTSVSTAFLRPMGKTGSGTVRISNQASRATNDSASSVSPFAINCSDTEFKSGGYACSATLDLPNTLMPDNGLAFIVVKSLYNDTNFRASLSNGVKFNNVQPLVDSNGRAGDVYRRVSSRVSVGGGGDLSALGMPEYAVDITGSLCKDFVVHDQGVISGSGCKTQPET